MSKWCFEFGAAPGSHYSRFFSEALMVIQLMNPDLTWRCSKTAQISGGFLDDQLRGTTKLVIWGWWSKIMLEVSGFLLLRFSGSRRFRLVKLTLSLEDPFFGTQQKKYGPHCHVFFLSLPGAGNSKGSPSHLPTSSSSCWSSYSLTLHRLGECWPTSVCKQEPRSVTWWKGKEQPEWSGRGHW